MLKVCTLCRVQFVLKILFSQGSPQKIKSSGCSLQKTSDEQMILNMLKANKLQNQSVSLVFFKHVKTQIDVKTQMEGHWWAIP